MKVLFLTRLDFWESANTGGKMVSKRNYEILKKAYGEENLFYCGVGEDMKEYREEHRYSFPVKRSVVSDYGNYIFRRYGYSKKTEKNILQYINKMAPDLIFLDGSWMGGLLKKVTCRSVVVFFFNIEANVIRKSININGKIKLQRLFRYWCTRYNENLAARNADYRICLNQRDADLLKKFYDKDTDFFLPTTIRDSFDRTKYEKIEEDVRSLLFVGANFAPNVHGLDWFIQNVLSYIDCKLVIVGSGMKKYHPPVESEKVEIVGEVEDLAEYYVKVSAVVCPIFLGDGMKTKTAEAMMYGKTIFATDEALEGYEINDVKNIFRCNTDIEFVEKIKTYFINKNNCPYKEDVRERFISRYEFSSKYREFYEWSIKEGLL